MGNRATNEVRFDIRVLVFPALRNLIIKCPLGSAERDIFISLINYLPLDELHELKVPVTCFREAVLPDPVLVREGNITKESLLMKLQFIHRLMSLHTFELICRTALFFVQRFPETHELPGHKGLPI